MLTRACFKSAYVVIVITLPGNFLSLFQCMNIETDIFYSRIIRSSFLSSSKVLRLFPQLNSENQIKTSHFIEKIVCQEPMRECFMRCCKKCKPLTENLVEQLHAICEEENLEFIEYEMWKKVKEENSRLKVLPFEDYYTDFTSKTFIPLLEKLAAHRYEYKEQHKFYQHQKDNIPVNSALICSDFAGKILFT